MNLKFRLVNIWSLTIIYCLSISIVGSSFISNPLLDNTGKTTVSLFSKVVSDQHYLPAQIEVFSANKTAFESKDWDKLGKDNQAFLLADNQKEAVWLQDQFKLVAYWLQQKKSALIFPQHYFW